MSDIQKCTCGTCKYSRTMEVYDPVVDSMKYKFPSVPQSEIEHLIRHNITKCHLQGAPQKVHPEEDWCFKWEAR
jgi:hypothetical protein